MYVQLNSVIVDSDTGNRQELATFLGQFGVHPMAQLSSIDGLSALLNRGDAPQLVIVNLDPNTHENLREIGKLPREFPNISFFVMSQTLDANLLMDAMHMGVREFIPLPIGEEKFAAAIERVASAHGMGKRARTIHVIPTI
ncbi:MAG: pilus assembly protein CpaE, partial [Humisphaera sp.]|nr:pilus assembly protein CpaE [Humisphaera sp.]